MSKHILVVDDDQFLQACLQDVLEEEGYKVDTAADGLEALAQLDSQCHRYDTILLDLTMPHMDGLQFLQTLDKGTAFSSIIALSGDARALQQAVRMGIGHALSKPFDLDALLALVACPAACPAA